jgi:ATP-binding cassette, subfamily B, bacterial
VLNALLNCQVRVLDGRYGRTVRETVAHAFDTEIARICGALPGLEHHERAEYRDKLELVAQQQGCWASRWARSP